MVVSRCPCRLDLRAASMSFSTSLPVRSSRVRATEEFTVFGVEAPLSHENTYPGFETEEE
jgi:hypothetical protein